MPAVVLGGVAPARAQPIPDAVPPVPVSTPPAPPAAVRPDVEGAIGLITTVSPDYAGARGYSTRFRPAGFVRWGRFTLTGGGGFTTRRADEVERGLGAELVRRKDMKLRLGLRVHGGRKASANPMLAGLGDIDQTVRARLALQWDLAPGWRLGAGISADTLGKGGGTTADVSLGHEWQLPGGARFGVSAGVTGADDRYLQTWHGVTPEQSRLSGLPVYQPAAGLSSLQIGAVWRAELSPRWAGFVGAGLSHLLGSAAASPLTQRGTGASASAGLVWRF